MRDQLGSTSRPPVLRRGTNATVLFVLVAASAVLRCSQNNSDEFAEMLRADESFESDHGDGHRCPVPQQISVQIDKVRALSSSGSWIVTSNAPQTITLLPTTDLASPLGLNALAGGVYRGVMLHVLGGTVVRDGVTSSLVVPAHKLLIAGDFVVLPGQPVVFLPEVDPEHALRCLRDRDCEARQGHDPDHHGGDDVQTSAPGSSGPAGGTHSSGSDDHDRDDRRDNGDHQGSASTPHRACPCDHNLIWILRPVLPLAQPKPTLNCVRRIGQGYEALFGYKGVGNARQDVPIGRLNGFSPPPVGRGQPESFMPQVVEAAFTVQFDGKPLTWTLLGRSVTARASSPACADTGCGDCGQGRSCVAGRCVAVCGDGLCSLQESCRSCPADCGCPQGQVCSGDGCAVPVRCGVEWQCGSGTSFGVSVNCGSCSGGRTCVGHVCQ